jgi:hypothetical protein
MSRLYISKEFNMPFCMGCGPLLVLVAAVTGFIIKYLSPKRVTREDEDKDEKDGNKNSKERVCYE